ncbi:hypothetical protein G9464_09765 [Halostella sp. JP-L12]|uniref:hypothetical protein n=1 Tax=Halostella TaxID=1843185 RepID=UPI000EF83A5F|nr:MULTISPECIES: hypothetical protein [Halostella]NHN47883.1 hypothetical protein [Halostella sp. JP-L12]
MLETIAVVGDLLALGVLALLAVLPGAVAGLLWSPLLLSDRLSELFRRLPPTGSTAANYSLVAVALSLPWVFGAIAAIAGAPSDPAGTSNALLNLTVPLAAAYVVGLPLVAGVGLPRLGVDWDPTGYGPGTWLLLVVGAAWYAAVFALPLFAFALVAALPT